MKRGAKGDYYNRNITERNAVLFVAQRFSLCFKCIAKQIKQAGTTSDTGVTSDFHNQNKFTAISSLQ
jgi:hypothetical protein